MAILTKALFALVRGDFMAFTFFSARHTLQKFCGLPGQTGYELTSQRAPLQIPANSVAFTEFPEPS